MFGDSVLWWHGAWDLTGFWYWALSISLLMILWGALESENAGPVGFFTFLVLLFLHVTGRIDVGLLLENPWWLLWGVPYCVVGLVFCLYRYRYWLRGYLHERAVRPDQWVIDNASPRKQLDKLALWTLYWWYYLLELMFGDWGRWIVRELFLKPFLGLFNHIWQAEVEKLPPSPPVETKDQ